MKAARSPFVAFCSPSRRETLVYGGVAWESCALSWLAVALPLGRLQKKKGNKKAEWQPERGKEELLQVPFGTRTVGMQVENKRQSRTSNGRESSAAVARRCYGKSLDLEIINEKSVALQSGRKTKQKKKGPCEGFDTNQVSRPSQSTCRCTCLCASAR